MYEKPPVLTDSFDGDGGLAFPFPSEGATGDILGDSDLANRERYAFLYVIYSTEVFSKRELRWTA